MSQNEQIDFEGSDDDIRAKFEHYLTQLFHSIEYDQNPTNMESGAKKIDYMTEYNLAWIKAWKESPSFKIWSETHDAEMAGLFT